MKILRVLAAAAVWGLSGPALAAGVKTGGGGFVILDDLYGGAGGGMFSGTCSGSPCSVVGAAGQVANAKTLSGAVYVLEGGFFAYRYIIPAIAADIPDGSVRSTLGGSITGLASDPVGVTSVTLTFQKKDPGASTGLFWDWNPSAPSFSASVPISTVAYLTAGQYAASTGWRVPFVDAALTNFTSYYFRAAVINTSGDALVVESTFVFNAGGLVSGGLGDGGGSANVLPGVAAGCQLVTSTFTFVAGSTGVATGGAIAVHIPDGWTRPIGLTAQNPPSQSGFLNVASTTSFTVSLNPPQLGAATLGDNWIVYNAAAPVTPGQTIYFTYTAFPPTGAGAQTAQVYAAQVKDGAAGNLVSISSSPSQTLTVGSAARLAFSPDDPLNLGPLQTTPTMQVTVSDACGVATTVGAPLTVSLSAGDFTSTDPAAKFFAAGGAQLSPAQVTIAAGQGASSSFYYNTSTANVSSQFLIADATLGGSPSRAARFARLLSNSVAISSVSVDTGTLSLGAETATMTVSGFLAPAVVNFKVADGVRWEVIISTMASTFEPKVAHRFGVGDPGRTVAWNALNESQSPPWSVPPGVYYVKISADGGVAVKTGPRIYIPQSASIHGQLGASGAGAHVSAFGPGTHYGNFGVASSTGYFKIYGLEAGKAYNVEAATGVIAFGEFMRLTASAANVVAANGGTSAGTLTFPTPSRLRVSVSIPTPPRQEVWGGVFAHNADYSKTGYGALHYSTGSSSSDNGALSFGQNSSTWTAIGLGPDTYDLDINLYQLGISTKITGVVLGAGQSVDTAVNVARKANVYGFAHVPSSSPYGAWVSVQGLKEGEKTPSLYGGAFVLPTSFGFNTTSGAYALFGLDPGTWTFTAKAFGFVGVSSGVVISSDADVGNPLSGGMDLYLTSGGVIAGTVTVNGDTTLVKQSGPNFDLYVNAYNPVTFTHSGIRVTLPKNGSVTSSTFSLAGLENGTWYLSSRLEGFTEARAAALVSAGQGSANLQMTANDARIFLTVKLPGGPHPPSEFRKVALLVRGSGINPKLRQDMTEGNTVQYHLSSATLQSPPLGLGFYVIEALYAKTGMHKIASVPLTQGATAQLTLDLSGSTFTVSGKVSMTGNISFSSANYSVTVSSIPGLLANAGATSYCLMGSTLAVTTSTFHLELLPVSPFRSEFLNGPLFVSTSPTTDCSSVALPNGVGSNSPNPFHGYLAGVGLDGSFSFRGVPAGAYVLRNNAEIDNDSTNGLELPILRQFINVSTDVAGLSLNLDAGVQVSGNVILPPQVTASRAFRATVVDSLGKVVRAAVVNFNNQNAAPYFFEKIGDVSYAIQVEDLGYPKLYAAKPVTISVLGLSLQGKDIQLVQSGVIRGKIALQQRLPDGTTGPFTLVTNRNIQLLPRDFKIQAFANPWFQGGFASARGAQCGPDGCGGIALDGADQFVIENLLPGDYDVKLLSRNDPSDTGAGAVSVVSALLPAVDVREGRVTDVGTVNMVAALELRGKVYDGFTGSGLANVRIEARPAIRQSVNRDLPRASTDKNGDYVLPGLDPNVRFYDVFVGARGDFGGLGSQIPLYEQRISPSVDLASTSVMNFPLSPATYAVGGRVVPPAGGAPLLIPFSEGAVSRQGAVVFLQKANVIPIKNPIADLEALTDQEGNFLVQALTTGTYRLTVASLGYGSLGRTVTISTGSLDLGTLTMPSGGTLSGSIKKQDGAAPSQDEARTVVAATLDLSEILIASLTKDANTRTVTGYKVSGFRAGVTYRVVIIDEKDNFYTPDEARAVVFSTASESRTLDLVYRQSKPSIFSKAKRAGVGKFQVVFQFSQPLRSKTADDDDLELILTTFSANGSLSGHELSYDRRQLTALYTSSSGVSESSFTLRVSAYSSVTNPDSLDPVNPEFILSSTPTFFAGIDGFHQSRITNFAGGNLIVEGDNGRVTLPGGAFDVDPSSTVEVTLQLSSETLATVQGLGVSRMSPKEIEALNMRSLRYSKEAYPSDLLRAMAAKPPEVSPFSGFYDILLPLGVRTALSKPTPITVQYSSGTDPSTLNLYWYNAAANAYVIQQDVTGSAPVIDTVNRTITLNVNHFSTFVLFQTGVQVITGDVNTGATIEAFNFPNPFDLSPKTVTRIHPAGGGTQNDTVRGTMIRFSLPSTVAGDANLRIFTTSGERVRNIELGTLEGGRFYYQAWDGRNDAGHDVASGIYLGQIRVGKASKFFKMALIK